jgi:integrase
VTIRKEMRGGKPRLIIDIPYRTADGQRARYRRDAQVQTKAAAEAEHRRLVAELSRSGTLKAVPKPQEAAPTNSYTFEEAVRHFRATYMSSALKPSTRASYNRWLDALLLPRFATMALDAVDGNALAALDAELATEGLAASTRSNIHSVFRSVLRTAARAGFLAAMPTMPALPKIGRKVPQPMRRNDLDALLGASSPNARLAFGLAAFAGLRASEVRGLRWSDVDLTAATITVRRGITIGVETTPKSHHHRVIPLARVLRELLETAKATKPGPWSPVALTVHGKPWGEFGLNQAFKRAQKRIGRSGWTFHSLRHFFVTELFRRNAPAVAIQRLAGHSELATTQRYADFDADDLRAAIERFDGKDVETSSPVNPGLVLEPLES